MKGGGATKGSILLVRLDVPDLSTVGTFPSRSSRDFVDGARRSSVARAGLMMQLLLLFSGLSSCLVFLKSLELLLDPGNQHC